MLVGPGGAAAEAFHHFKDGIGLDGIVWKHWYTMTMRSNSPRQLRGINHIQRNVRRVIQIDALIENHVVSGRSRTGRVCGIEIAPVVADVVKQAVCNRRSASHQGEKTRK